MAPHSSTPAWKIPWMEEPGRLRSMGSLRVGHDWATSLWLFTFMHWRRKWQPTPVFLPGESQGRGSLAGCRLWGHAGSDMTEATWQQQQQSILVHWFLECRHSLLSSPVWPLPIFLDSWTWHSRFLCIIPLYSNGPCFYHRSHPQLGIVFALAPCLHSFCSYFSTDLQ